MIAAIMFGVGNRWTDPIEYFVWSGWHHAAYLGAFAVGAFILIARPARRLGRSLAWLMRRRRAGMLPGKPGVNAGPGC